MAKDSVQLEHQVIVDGTTWTLLQVTLMNEVARANRMLDLISSSEGRSKTALQELVEQLDEELRNLRAALEEQITPF